MSSDGEEIYLTMLGESYDEQGGLVKNVLDIINNAILLVNSKGQIVFVNSKACRMFNSTSKELVEKPVELLFVPEDRRVLVHNILVLTRKNGEFESEAMLEKVGGSAFLGLISTSLISNRSGSDLVLSINDITRLKGLEQKLKSSERIAFLGRMLDDISHQIRNPVMAIGGLAGHLHKSDNPKPAHIEAIKEESKRLEGLLDALNHFINLPRPLLKPEKLGTLVEKMELRFSKLVAEQDCQWDFHYSKEILEETVSIDTELLARALEAVVINACESYASASPKKIIKVELSRAEPDLPITITITDTGGGIAKEDLPKVFAHFFTRKTHHIGMGLTVAQRIQNDQGGDVSLISSPGVGTRVTLSLVSERRRSIRVDRISE